MIAINGLMACQMCCQLSVSDKTLDTLKDVGVSFLSKGCDNSNTDCRKEIGHFSKINRAGCFLKVDQLTLDC